MLKPLLITTFFILVVFQSLSQGLEEHFLSALDNSDSTATLFEELETKLETKIDSGMYFYYLARFQNIENNPRQAVETLLKSLPYFSSKESSNYLISAYNNLTYLESILGNWEKSMLYGQTAYEKALAVNDSSRMGYSLADLGIVYHDMEQYEKGVEYAKKGYEILSASSNPDTRTKVFAINAIAINFDDWDKPDSALFYHYKNLEFLSELDSSAFTNTFNNIGNTLLKQGRYAEAKQWVEISLKYNYRSMDSYKLATNFTNLATIAYNLDRYNEAEQMMDSAYHYVQLSDSREKLRDYLYDQFRFQKKKGDLNLALDYLEQYAALKDTIFKEDRVQMMGELETRYEVSEKERQLAESRAQLAENELLVKNRNNQLLLLLIVLLISLGLGFFIYYRQKNKNWHLEQEAKLQKIFAEQQTQKRLQEQRQRISSDLHDNIGAQLTFIISSLNNLKFLDLPKDVLGKKLDQISEFTTETINELRDTIWAMNKDSITLDDLQGRLAGLLEKAKSSCPNTDFNLELGEKLDENFQLNSLEGINHYRIAQEAIQNAIKHAEASEIKVSLLPVNNHLSLLVQDNGKGINSSRKTGNGLGNMKVRAERIGREIQIESEIGKGTKVLVF
ncbi:tetratricopeptide repeat-containing sensor histidine kinase [Algoriphagus limi]|uniref:histidine kinase n=1 Tax=Algoriphagus limi TaxID=2975273 RepID=A0ABT2G951_9BACT|nr:tetratricopeptide repeat-containing sensor histidine kinase [Algoriphagus limi]MCS5490956.1 tetratricopeptide repeat protein [Algoriphagus limi]